MLQNLIRRLEALETHQFGSPRVAKWVRFFNGGDLPEVERFSDLEELTYYLLTALSEHESDCLNTFRDRLAPDDVQEILRKHLAEAREEAAGHNLGTQERYGLDKFCKYLEMRLSNLEDYLRSKTSVLAMPLDKPVRQSKFRR
jgi:hypothetical protein